MKPVPSLTARPAPGRFVLVEVALVAAVLVFFALMDRRLTADREERGRELVRDLNQAVLSALGEIRRPRVVRERVRSLMTRIGAAAVMTPLAEESAAIVARRCAAAFPGATVYGFDRSGRLAWQSGGESRRPREMLWKSVLDLWRRPEDDSRAARFQTPSKICHTLYGSLVDLADLVPQDDLPRPIQAKGAMKLSLVLPREILARAVGGVATGGGSGGDGPGGIGLDGVWIVIDTGRVPTAASNRRALASLARVADTAFIVDRNNGNPRLIDGIGLDRFSRRTLRRFFAGRTEFTDRRGTWVARYVPDECGRYLVAGIRPERCRGDLDRVAPLVRAGVCVALVLGTLLGLVRFGLGRPLGIGLAPLVFLLFGVTSVLPLAFVVSQGLDLAYEKGRQERSEWERRLRVRLAAVDQRHLEYQRERLAALAPIEARLAAAVPLGSDTAGLLDRLCADMDRVQVLLHDETGRKIPWRKNLENLLDQGDNPAFQARYLARVIAAEGRVPARDLTEGFVLLEGHALEAVINLLYRESDRFDRLRVRGRSVWLRRSLLVRPEGSDTRALGVISWAFEELSFSRPFVTDALRWFARPENRLENAVFGFVSREAGAFPEALAASVELRRMVERVETYHAPETGVVRFPDGRAYLAVVIFPARLSGFIPVGLVEVPAEGEGLRWRDLPHVLGLAEPLPLDRSRIFVLRLLLVSVVAALFVMLPIAVVLSRWLVGRVAGIQAMVGRIAANDLQARALVAADDELGHLAGSLNDMAQGLQEREQMTRFVSDEVVREVRKDDRESLALGGERREVAVVFTHIHQFDELVSRASPAETMDFLNDYLTFVDAGIRDSRGSIDKLIGDAVLAVFFAEPGLAHPARRAMAAAMAVRAREAEFNERRREAGRFTVRTDLGLHFGPVISGKVGSRHGMIDFTVIGDTVNTAARIQAQAAREPTAAILVSRDLLAHLEPGLPVTPLPPVALKGKAVPLGLFRVGEKIGDA